MQAMRVQIDCVETANARGQAETGRRIAETTWIVGRKIIDQIDAQRVSWTDRHERTLFAPSIGAEAERVVVSGPWITFSRIEDMGICVHLLQSHMDDSSIDFDSALLAVFRWRGFGPEHQRVEFGNCLRAYRNERRRRLEHAYLRHCRKCQAGSDEGEDEVTSMQTIHISPTVERKACVNAMKQ